MFFVHGGGFSHDSSDDNIHGPDFLIDEGVILVRKLHTLTHIKLCTLFVAMQCKSFVMEKVELYWV